MSDNKSAEETPRAPLTYDYDYSFTVIVYYSSPSSKDGIVTLHIDGIDNMTITERGLEFVKVDHSEGIISTNNPSYLGFEISFGDAEDEQ